MKPVQTVNRGAKHEEWGKEERGWFSVQKARERDLTMQGKKGRNDGVRRGLNWKGAGRGSEGGSK